MVVDLYAGSGALGLEALSRGARHVTFVERARGPLATLVGGQPEGDGGAGAAARSVVETQSS